MHELLPRKLVRHPNLVSSSESTPLTRREFSFSAAALTLLAGLPSAALWPRPARAGQAAAHATIDLVALDRHRILTHADRYLSEQPVTITAFHSDRSAGGPHDYFSEADYFWPDPKNPGGPYINRDGQSNPDNFNDDRLALIRLSLQMPCLTAAWKITRERRYAAHAAAHLRAWFVTPATRMNPNLQYAQAIHGRYTGRNYGIIDTLHLVEVARAISVLQPAGALTPDEYRAVIGWFTEYLHWLTTSEHGVQERDTKNNHSTTWLLQAAEFARLTGNGEVTAFCRDRLRDVIIPRQIAPDGSLPLELARTKPYSYSLFDMDALATCCQVLSTAADDLWTFQTPDGRSVGAVIAFMVPYIRDKASWPYRKDVEHFDEFPVRQPALLFGGLALDRPAWLGLFRRLDPDPTSPEVIRNFPIRQPVLWV